MTRGSQARLRGPRRFEKSAAAEGVAREQGAGEEAEGLRRRGASGRSRPGPSGGTGRV